MEQQENSMTLAAMILGILSLALSCCCGMGVVFGGLAVILACLSKTEERFSAQAKAGLITGGIGMLLSLLSWILLAVSFSGGNPYRGYLPY